MKKQKLSNQNNKKKVERNESQSEIEKHPHRNEFIRQSIRKSLRKISNDPPIRPPRKKRNRQTEEPRVVTGLQRRRSMRGSTRCSRNNRSNM